jgi:aryl-alcohol dehydrogenase-like predicted oxidoreductase
METLVKQGKIVYAGSSNFAAWNIAQANCIGAQRHFLGLASEQSLYNLTARTVELEVVPACLAFGMALLPWSPLAAGVLAGSANAAKGGRRDSDFVRTRVDKRRQQLEDYDNLCRKLGEKPADVALAWLLHQPAVTAPIIGPRTREQLEGSLHAVEIKLDKQALQQLDTIWPGPGGQAPEAYAW